MNRQCRICLDTDNPQSMIAPCLCRGSAEFIHKICLEEYIRHFPDNICRVCRTNMTRTDYYHIFTQFVLCFWLTGLLFFSNISTHTKLVYLFMSVVLMVFMSVRKMLSYWLMFLVFGVSVLMNAVYPSDLVKLSMFLGTLSTLATISYYIPPQYVFMLFVIILSSLYATLLLIFIATHTDPYMSAFFTGFTGLCWYTCVRLRQPFN
jgi:E3 ubiquitin-protein ligase DOA10